MSAPSPKWYDDTNTELAAALSFADVSPGAPSTAQEIRLINNLSGTGADPLTNSRIIALVRDVGETSFVSGGKEYADRFYVEMRVIGGRNMTPANTPWTPLGAGRFFPLEEIANDAGIHFELRINPPANATVSNFEVTLAVEQSPAEFLQLGISESAADGIYHGLGDAGAREHVVATDVVENSGGADNQVEHGLQVWIGGGEVWSLLDGLTTLSAAASGKERFDLLSLKADGTLEVTAGTEVAAPATDPDDKPTLPTGNLALAFVLVDDTGVINNGNIENVWTHGLLGAVGSSLNLNVGGGRAVVDNAMVFLQTMTPVPLVANDTNWVWLLRSGGFSVNQTGTPPEDRALLLYEATTDASSVTSLVDRRHLIGGDLYVLRFDWTGTVVVNDERYHVLPSFRTARLLPIGPAVASVGAIGDGTGGQLRFDVEVDDGGFATLFTVGTHPPEIPFDDADLVDVDSVPEVWTIPGHARIRAKPTTLPSGAGTDPSDATLLLLVVL